MTCYVFFHFTYIFSSFVSFCPGVAFVFGLFLVYYFQNSFSVFYKLTWHILKTILYSLGKYLCFRHGSYIISSWIYIETNKMIVILLCIFIYFYGFVTRFYFYWTKILLFFCFILSQFRYWIPELASFSNFETI